MEESLKYKERLLQSDQEKAQEDVQFQVKQAELQLEADMLATQKSLAESEKTLAILKSSFPLQPDDIVETAGQVAELKAGLKFLEDLKKELF